MPTVLSCLKNVDKSQAGKPRFVLLIRTTKITATGKELTLYSSAPHDSHEAAATELARLTRRAELYVSAHPGVSSLDKVLAQRECLVNNRATPATTMTMVLFLSFEFIDTIAQMLNPGDDAAPQGNLLVAMSTITKLCQQAPPYGAHGAKDSGFRLFLVALYATLDTVALPRGHAKYPQQQRLRKALETKLSNLAPSMMIDNAGAPAPVPPAAHVVGGDNDGVAVPDLEWIERSFAVDAGAVAADGADAGVAAGAGAAGAVAGEAAGGGHGAGAGAGGGAGGAVREAARRGGDCAVDHGKRPRSRD